jgi:hypothetical protein
MKEPCLPGFVAELSFHSKEIGLTYGQNNNSFSVIPQVDANVITNPHCMACYNDCTSKIWDECCYSLWYHVDPVHYQELCQADRNRGMRSCMDVARADCWDGCCGTPPR